MVEVENKPDLSHAFIDMFSGAGGFSLGLINAGWKCIAGIEYAPDAALTYWRNLCLGEWSSLKVDPDNERAMKILSHGDPENIPTFDWSLPFDDWLNSEGKFPALSLWCRDVNKFEPEELMNCYGIEPGKLGAIVGGPPCQGFSWANTKRHQSDERNQLVFRYLDFVEKIKPKIFLIENVPGILSMGKLKTDNEGPFPVWIRERANEIGYNLTYDIHDAKDYGVPQRRKRVIFYGSRKDLNLPEVLPMEPTHTHNYFDYVDNDQLSLFDIKPEGIPYVGVFEAIGDLDMPLSSYRDVDAKKLPFGDRGRGPSELTKDNHYKDGDDYYMKDRFTGEFFPVPITPWSDHQKKYYVKCADCGRINLKVRDRCHSCGSEKN